MARVALIQRVMVEYVGYMSIAAVLKKAGHEVELFITRPYARKKFIKNLQDFQPDLVAFSVLSSDVPYALDLSRLVKNKINTLTAFGNVAAIFNPDIIENPGVDIVCLGEGEYPLLEICDRIDSKRDYTRIPGLWVKTAEGIQRNPPCDELVHLDALPYFDRTIYDKYLFFRHSKYLRISIGRGCPYRCSFCSNAALAEHYGGSRYVRKLSPSRAVEEIQYQVTQRKKVKHILFTDEVLWVQNDWLREFLALYKQKVNLPFTANFRFGPIQEEEIRLLAEAGAHNLIVATETGDETQRKQLLNKNVSDEHIIQIVDWLRKYKINFASSIMFGLPGDTVEDHINRLEFFRRIRPGYLYTGFFQPYPGIAMTKSKELEGFFSKADEFGMTIHDVPCSHVSGKLRLIRLKKIYFLCVVFPRLSPFLLWLTKFPVPFLFDLLFMLHFAYYVFTFEGISFLQICTHAKIFLIDPLFEKLGASHN